MKCANCQRPLPQEKIFCPDCGQFHEAVLTMLVGAATQQGSATQSEVAAHIQQMLTYIAKDPSNASLHLELGDFYLQHNQRGEALLEYMKALNLRPDWSVAKNRVQSIQESSPK